MSFRSALYVGHVAHTRIFPKRYALRHRVYWLLVDLEELAEMNSGLRLFSHNRTNLIALHDRDHGDGSRRPLRDQALDHLSAAGLDNAGVSVRLLCMPRVAGYGFNPLSVYFCSSAGGRLIAMIYEVNNTFGGRHSYVIPVAGASDGDGTPVRQACDKEFYVSPFMDLDMTYRFHTSPPGEGVSLSVQVLKNDRAVINTSLHGRRRQLSDSNILGLAATHPLLPIKVMAAIHWHALKLWLRGFAVNPAKPSRSNSVSIVDRNE